MKKDFCKTILSSIVVLLLALISPYLAAAQEYIIDLDIPDIPGDAYMKGAYDLNNVAQVVGVVEYVNYERAFLWQDGITEDLGTLGGNWDCGLWHQ